MLVTYLLTTQIDLYTNCSTASCIQCFNDFICQTCLTPSCCPKYCQSCLDYNHCLLCQTGFTLKYYSNYNWMICTRIQNQTDPQRLPSNSSQCYGGFYYQNYTNSCHSCPVLNCISCINRQNCDQCQQGFFYYQAYQYFGLSTHSVIVNKYCQQCSSNCTQCNNSYVCTYCQVGYFLKNGYCLMCQILNCFQCLDQTTCQACIVLAYMPQGTSNCTLCSSQINNCASCNYSSSTSNSLNCTVCGNGYFLSDPNKCSKCPTYCASCNSPTQCTSCVFKYGVNYLTYACQYCGIGCQYCIREQISQTLYCQQCSSNFYANYTLNISTCKPCPYPCIQCQMSNSTTLVCLQCSQSFYLNLAPLNNYFCFICNLDNCIQCNSQTNCTLCNDGFYLSINLMYQTYFCQSCPQNCKLCITNNQNTLGPPICTQCVIEYLLNGSNCIKNKIKNCAFYWFVGTINTQCCAQCINGYMVYLSYFGSTCCIDCILCNIQNCKTCNQTAIPPAIGQKCIACYAGFYLSPDNLVCLSCQLNCIECLNSSFCNECNQSYYVVIQNNGNTICQLCPQNCIYCNENQCFNCIAPYFQYEKIINSTTVRYQCGLCNISGCVDCKDENYCKLCTQIGYYAVPTRYGNCSQCVQNCISCDVSNQCTQCESGYLLKKQSNECFDESIPIWAMFGICIFGLTAIYIIIEKIIRRVRSGIDVGKQYSRSKQKDNDDSNKDSKQIQLCNIRQNRGINQSYN